jgi:hypothetical protein
MFIEDYLTIIGFLSKENGRYALRAGLRQVAVS